MDLRAIVLSLGALCCLQAQMTQAAQVIELQILSRPPYLIVEHGGRFGGIAVEAAVGAFDRAGIAVRLTNIPALRQIERLKANREALCSVGWYKTAEREAFARFSEPITIDAPWAALVAAKWQLPPRTTVDALLGDPNLTLLLKKGYVYGDYLDRKLTSSGTNRIETTSEMSDIFKMIEVNHGDFTLSPLDEIKYFQESGLIDVKKADVVTFTDMPAGQARYLMCSQMVGEDVLARFNAALRLGKRQH